MAEPGEVHYAIDDNELEESEISVSSDSDPNPKNVVAEDSESAVAYAGPVLFPPASPGAFVPTVAHGPPVTSSSLGTTAKTDASTPPVASDTSPEGESANPAATTPENSPLSPELLDPARLVGNEIFVPPQVDAESVKATSQPLETAGNPEETPLQGSPTQSAVLQVEATTTLSAVSNPPAVLPTGIAVAQTPKQMKERLNQDEIADRSATSSPDRNTPSAMTLRGVDAGHEAVPGILPERGSHHRHNASQSETAAFDPSALASSPSEERLGLSETGAPVRAPKETNAARLLEGITQAAATVRRFERDSVALVLRPDSNTEISLRLAMRDGKVEALASCDRGDVHSLRAHWPELREALDQHGVRLLDLQSRTTTSSTSDAGFAGFPHQQPRQFTRSEDYDTRRVPDITQKTKPLLAASDNRAAASNRLFESWA